MNVYPPSRRTAAGQLLGQHNDGSALTLPRCCACGTVQYPVRERCRHCLGDRLEWERVGNAGTLLTWTGIHASVEPWFRQHLPWPIARVQLACGPIVIAHLGAPEPRRGMPLEIRTVTDPGGSTVLVALEAGAEVPPEPVAALLRG